MIDKKVIKNVHFVGIGGIGMSSLALFLRSKKVVVSGSDIGRSPIIKKLKTLGCKIDHVHMAENIKDPDLVVYSSAIKKNNPELISAKKKGIGLLTRGEALGLFTNKMKNITITGCHGKSTTSSISHCIIKNSNIDLTAFIGAEDRVLGSNFYLGNSKFCLIEGDESDNSFNKINSHISVITNIDNDHLDFYGSEKKLISAFKKFIINTKTKCIANNDSPILAKLLKSFSSKKIIQFGQGLNLNNDYSFDIIKNKFSSIKLFKKQKIIGKISSKLYGDYNAYNLAAGSILALELGITLDKIQENSLKCKAPIRRFESIINNKKVRIIDDYAHHPTAIKAIRENINKNFLKNEVILVFQPHRFTRTSMLLEDFVEELSSWKNLYLVNIYSAFEKNNVDANKLFDKIKKRNAKAQFFENNEILIDKIISKLKYKKYTIITMGAGDIREVGIKLKKRI